MRKKEGTFKGTYPESANGNYKVVDTIGVPHPYCIGSKLVAFAADRHNGILGEAAIEDAERHGIHCEICKEKMGKPLSYAEHKQALVIESKVEIDPTPNELKEYLLSIKEEAEKNGYVGFAFKKYEPPKPPQTWPGYKLPDGFHLGDRGCGCFLEPPGHPTYFVRPIYNSRGDSPSRPPYYKLSGTGYEDLDDLPFTPIPYESPRVKEWEINLYRHMTRCYHDESIEDRDKTMIFPVPYYKLKHFLDDPRFSEEWRIKERAAIKQANDAVIAHALKVAVPENHRAYLAVKKYYPDAKPRLELIGRSKFPPSSNWWTIMEERPTPDKCPGEYGKPHPVNGDWCQFCGWMGKKEADENSDKA
ncbi:MAG: hypothetical protein WC359_12500 [Dehalococcoidia bacterium]|jgi:hypothetical protein